MLYYPQWTRELPVDCGDHRLLVAVSERQDKCERASMRCDAKVPAEERHNAPHGQVYKRYCAK